MRITKTFHFNAAHRLKDYDGVCKNIHGHNYIVHITVEGLDDEVMVLDFKIMNEAKNIVNECRDHAFLYEEGDNLGEYIAGQGLKTYKLVKAPSTEVLCKELFLLLQQHTDWAEMVYSIEIEETPTCKALRTRK